MTGVKKTLYYMFVLRSYRYVARVPQGSRKVPAREAASNPIISLGEVINRDEINILDNFVRSDETKNSKHKYTPEEFGLTDFQINDRFSEYIKHYGL